MIDAFGYGGIFVVSALSTASVIVPLPGFIFILAAGGVSSLNPWLVALVASAGMAIGEMTGYVLGKGGGKVLGKSKKENVWLKRGEKWFEEGKGFLFIFIFAATPLPDDVTGILGGMFNYDLKMFFLATFLGKLVMNIILVFGGLYGISWLSMLPPM